MSRFAAVAFGALVVATVAAFFVTQHLKVSTPLIAGDPAPVPSLIDPYGPPCPRALANGEVLPDHRRMYISFYLLHRSDDVAVYIVDSEGAIVRTLASNRHMRKGVRIPDGEFTWDGREDNGTVAPDGTYYIRVALLHQGRTVQLTNFAGRAVTVMVKSRPPSPRITSVSVDGHEPAVIPQAGAKVTINYTGNEHRSGYILIYRTDLPGPPRLVKAFKSPAGKSQAIWDGMIHGQPAPQGTYLIGMKVSDATCATGRFPPSLPPVPGSTRRAGVTVHYLVAQPPLTATPAGSRATVYVDSVHRPYTWRLWRVGARKASVSGRGERYALTVKLPPAQGAGLYHLVINSGGQRTDVPMIADHPGTANRPRILVVLPALSWQGENPVDDDGDGLPNTLTSREPVRLARPLVDGLPSGWGEESALLAYLDRAALPYDLTTDLGLIGGGGPKLSQYRAIALAGSETWVPPALGRALRSYVEGGGQILSLGLDSLLRGVTIAGGVASAPTAPAAIDVLGGRPGPLTQSSDLITVIRDGLGIFTTTSGAFPGYHTFTTLTVGPPGQLESAAGTTTTRASIVGYRLARGAVIDVGLAGFAASLDHNVNGREFLARVWSVLRTH